MLLPKLWTTLRDGYSRQQLATDVTSGLIVGVVALPLCIAFAIASGVSPEKGLITGAIAGFVISALGGSRVQIGGPAGAFVVIVYGIVQQYGLEGLAISTLMAGVILILMGVAGFGSVIRFIPQPVVVGFTSGIAVIILTTQINDLLGLNLSELPANFLEKMPVLFAARGNINLWAVGISTFTIAVMLLWPRVTRKFPGSLVALILATVLVEVLKLPVETIGSHFGPIPMGLPELHFPELTLEKITHLIAPATTIAILVAIESLLSAVVSDGMISGAHRSNMELIAQGVANIASTLAGGIPATGAIARTATNVRNGGRTPVAGITHAFVLLGILLAFGRLANLIPLACLAAILVVVAYHMSEWRTVRAMLHRPKSDVLVLLTTFGLTVVIDLTVAIEVGMVLAAFLFIKRMAGIAQVEVVTRQFADKLEEPEAESTRRAIDEGFEVYEVSGPFFFGAVYKFREAMRIVRRPAEVRILRMRQVNAIDSSGIQALEDVYHTSQRQGTSLILSGVHAQPFSALNRAGLLQLIGEENVLASFSDALARARELRERRIQERSEQHEQHDSSVTR